MARPIRDFTGYKFNHLTILYLAGGSGKGKHARWMARCDCGNLKEFNGQAVSRGRIKTCGTCQYTRDLIARKGHRIPGTSMPAAKRDLYRRYMDRAGRGGFEWSLLPEEFHQLTSQDCTYCGEAPHRVFRHSKLIYNGLDRVDNTRGYTLDNCMPCCTMCNKMKLTYTAQEFLDKVMQIAARIEQARQPTSEST